MGSRRRTGRGAAGTGSADEGFESRAIGGLGVDVFALGAELVGEDVRDEIFLRREVGVKGAVGAMRPAAVTAPRSHVSRKALVSGRRE